MTIQLISAAVILILLLDTGCQQKANSVTKSSLNYVVDIYPVTDYEMPWIGRGLAVHGDSLFALVVDSNDSIWYTNLEQFSMRPLSKSPIKQLRSKCVKSHSLDKENYVFQIRDTLLWMRQGKWLTVVPQFGENASMNYNSNVVLFKDLDIVIVASASVPNMTPFPGYKPGDGVFYAVRPDGTTFKIDHTVESIFWGGKYYPEYIINGSNDELTISSNLSDTVTIVDMRNNKSRKIKIGDPPKDSEIFAEEENFTGDSVGDEAVMFEQQRWNLFNAPAFYGVFHVPNSAWYLRTYYSTPNSERTNEWLGAKDNRRLKLLMYNDSTHEVTTLKTGLFVASPSDIMQRNDQLYFVNYIPKNYHASYSPQQNMLDLMCLTFVPVMQ
jgi:hypothetical protein